MRRLLSDPARRRLQLSPTALAAGALLVAGRLRSEALSEALRQEVAGLEEVGAVVEGELVPWVAQILMLMLAPTLHVESVVADAAGEATTQVWARPEVAVLGRMEAGGWVDLAPTEPTLLAWTLADAVGLSARRASAREVPRRPIAASRIAAFEAALTSGDHREAGAILGHGHDLDEDELTLMAALAAPERRGWRISASWTTGDGPVERSLSIIDAGHAGLWRSEGAPEASEPGAEELTLVPMTVGDTWHRMVELLPPGTSASPDIDLVEPRSAPCPTPSQPIPTASCASP